jgi:hypothetical protein
VESGKDRSPLHSFLAYIILQDRETDRPSYILYGFFINSELRSTLSFGIPFQTENRPNQVVRLLEISFLDDLLDRDGRQQEGV